jgi:hypothetical protein
MEPPYLPTETLAVNCPQIGDTFSGAANMRIKPHVRAFSPIRTKHPERRDWLAEREGFEPSVPLPVRQISNLVPSTTRPPLRAGETKYLCGICLGSNLESIPKGGQDLNQMSDS